MSKAGGVNGGCPTNKCILSLSFTHIYVQTSDTFHCLYACRQHQRVQHHVDDHWDEKARPYRVGERSPGQSISKYRYDVKVVVFKYSSACFRNFKIYI